MGYLPPELAVPGQKVQVKMLGEMWEAEVTVDSPYDSKNASIRVDG